MWSNRDLVLAAVQQDGRALEYAAEPLKADRDLVLAAVQQDGSAREYTCNSFTCRACYTEFCLNCGQVKAGSHSSGYHAGCGRQPSWLQVLEPVPHLSNDDPRVQQPPPLLERI